MPKPFLITLTGPSGVGKESLGKHLVSVRPRFQLSVSTTTRLRRPGEIQGRDYFFVTREEFEREAILNQFLEWAQYADHLYGTPRNEIQRAMQAGKTLVAIVEVKGAKLIKARVPATLGIFIAPPEPALETLRRRLEKRCTESQEAIEKRLAIAADELMEQSFFDHVITNDDLEKTKQELVEYVESFIEAERV